MLDSLILLGDFKDVVIVVVSLAVLGLWVLSQVMGQKPNRPQQGPPRQRLGRPPERPGVERRPAEPNLDRNLREEIESFLKKAAAEREKGEAGAASAAEREKQKENERVKQRTLQKRQRQTQRQRQQARDGGSDRVERLDEVEILEEPARRSGGTLRPQIDTRDIQRHASQLGAEVGQADEKLAAHLRSTFGHQLSSFGAGTRPGGAPPIGLPQRMDTQVSPDAIDMSVVRSWLQNPAEIRQAIIMREILERPDSTRW